MATTDRTRLADPGAEQEQAQAIATRYRCEYIDLESLLAGRWRESLDRLEQKSPAPERPTTDGAEVVAEMIAGMLSRR